MISAFGAAESWFTKRAALPRPLALVLGNELIGVDTDVLAECDGRLQIPMFGMKNSINVATAGTVVISCEEDRRDFSKPRFSGLPVLRDDHLLTCVMRQELQTDEGRLA